MAFPGGILPRARPTSLDYVLDTLGIIYAVSFIGNGLLPVDDPNELQATDPIEYGQLLQTSFPKASDVRQLHACPSTSRVLRPDKAYGFLTSSCGQLMKVGTDESPESVTELSTKVVFLDKGSYRVTIEDDGLLYYHDTVTGLDILLDWCSKWPAFQKLTYHSCIRNLEYVEDAPEHFSLAIRALLVFAGGETIFAVWQDNYFSIPDKRMECTWLKIPNLSNPVVVTGDLRRGVFVTDDSGEVVRIDCSNYSPIPRDSQCFTFYEVNHHLSQIAILQHTSDNRLIIHFRHYHISTTIWGVKSVAALSYYHLLEDSYGQQYLLNFERFPTPNHGSYYSINTLPIWMWLVVPSSVRLVGKFLHSGHRNRFLTTKSSRTSAPRSEG